jgi:hypothetical protein
VIVAAASGAAGADLVCDGVLANSGGAGDALVRFGDVQSARGMGVVADRFGSLWDRAGDGTLNRYAPDGRLLGQYRIAKGAGGRDLLTRVGDLLVIQIGAKLYTLPTNAAAGTEAKALRRDSECLSFGAFDGQVASATKEALFLVNPATDEAKQVARLKGVDQLELGPDGAVYAMVDGSIHKFVAGKEAEDGWPRKGPGERIQLLDGWWYGHGWHGTIRRFSADLEPAPGVVLGGASGSFIGHLDQDPELSNGRGLAKLGADLFAVSGMGGVLHLLRWSEPKQQMEIVRRIGAAPLAGGIGLDRDGRVWWYAGAWQWNDRPDTPMLCGVNGPDYPGIGQAVMLDGERMVAPGWLWGKPALYHGKLSGEVAIDRIETPCALKKGTTGSVVYDDEKKRVLLVVEKGGAAQALEIDPEGRYRGDLGPVALELVSPAKEWTSLAAKDKGTLLAAADGNVVELVRDGKGWKESRRWNSWGPGEAEKFGARIWITADAGRLWIADRERMRVLCFDLASGKPVATFGAVDAKGTDLKSLALPETVAAKETRVVVFDAGNQRLVKLRLP